MLDTSGGEEIWPRGTAFVLSLDFARQPDIMDSLARTRWDLVIADDGHLVRGTRVEVLHQIGASAKHLIFASGTFHDFMPSDEFVENEEEASVVEWRRDQIIKQYGRQLYSTPRLVLYENSFRLYPSELRLRSTLGDLCRILVDAEGRQSFMAMSILRSLESSPDALEFVLRRFSEMMTMDRSEYPVEALEEEVPEENALTIRLDRATKEKASGVALQALQEIDELDRDSKLSYFLGWLDTLKQEKNTLSTDLRNHPICLHSVLCLDSC